MGKKLGTIIHMQQEERLGEVVHRFAAHAVVSDHGTL